jgi:hypothetical protein
MVNGFNHILARCRNALGTTLFSATVTAEVTREPVLPVMTQAERERREKQTLQIDQALHEFTQVMRAKMLRNLHKGDWQTAPFELLWDRAMLEIEELRIARKYETSDDARKECADVANFMMILFVRFAREGTLIEQTKKAAGK